MRLLDRFERYLHRHSVYAEMLVITSKMPCEQEATHGRSLRPYMEFILRIPDTHWLADVYVLWRSPYLSACVPLLPLYADLCICLAIWNKTPGTRPHDMLIGL